MVSVIKQRVWSLFTSLRDMRTIVPTAKRGWDTGCFPLFNSIDYNSWKLLLKVTKKVVLLIAGC